MVIIGAGGHAKEVADILHQMSCYKELFFFDNYSKKLPKLFLNSYPIIKSESELRTIFSRHPQFILGIGSPELRRELFALCIELGGTVSSLISSTAFISSFMVSLGSGINIMSNVVVHGCVSVGGGALLNTACSIHHDSHIGEFTEIGPGVRILGKSTIESGTFIGANAVVLPSISIGNNVTVAAGSVVTKNVPDNVMIAGVPATIKKFKVS